MSLNVASFACCGAVSKVGINIFVLHVYVVADLIAQVFVQSNNVVSKYLISVMCVHT